MNKKNVKQHTLKNGLKIICEHTPEAKSVGLGFFVKTGFKGTPKRSALELTFDMGNIGAQANAFTSEENTVYYATVLPEYALSMQEILSDMMRPTLDPQEFDTEKNVILEEIALYQDRPQFYLFDNASTDFFGSHPAGNSVLGSNESIKALTREQMKDYFDRRYAPNNIVFACAGNIDADAIIRQVESLCGGWSSIDAPRKYPLFSAENKSKIFQKPNIQQGHVLLYAQGPSAQDKERYALSMLSMILGDSSGSRMYYELVQTGIAESAGADTDEKDQAGNFYAYAVTEPNKTDQVSEIMRSIISKAHDFNDADLTRAKTKSISRIIANGELPMGRLMALGTEWVYLNQIQNLQDLISEVKAVTVSDIHAALEKFPLQVISEYRLLPT
jgi:predicted Zn-dependent peptidase